MPELPDVEILRRYFAKTALDQQIRDVRADPVVLEGISEADLEKALTGKTFSSTRRHGKHLFAGTGQSGPWLVMHFGMTGFLAYRKSGQEASEYARMVVTFASGGKLAFDCRRKLGRIRLAADPDAFVRDMSLGPDALDKNLDSAAFEQRMRRSRGTIKSAFMNQSVMAGIGNIYADEILFHAGIHPRRKISDISREEMAELYQSMARVLAAAIEADAEPNQMPDDFLLRRRQPDAQCGKCGGTVERIAVSGRNGYCCQTCQN